MGQKIAAADASSTDPENVSYDGKEYAVIKEGLASILVPPQAKPIDGKATAEQEVFYNSIQQFNRDLTVLAIKAFWEEKLARENEASAAKKNMKRKRDESGPIPETANKASKLTSDSNPQATATQEAEGALSKGNGDAATAPPDSVPEAAAQDGTATQDAGVGSANHTLDQKPAPAKRGFSILDALSASGLRALRYGHELPFVTSVTANDLTASAVESIKLNVRHNGLEDKITVSHDDALAHMYRRLGEDLSKRDKHGAPSKTNKYDVIDLDPYGTAAPFLDAAVQSVKEGGLLCVTCTDSAVWAGHSYCEKSYALYGGIPVKAFYSHEVGLRLILHAIATSAARYSLTIEPLLSVSVDYYVRIFVRVARSQANLKFLASKTMTAYYCGHGCGAWETQYLMRSRMVPSRKGGNMHYKHTMAQGPACDAFCPHCRTKMHIAGPMYGGYLHSPSFLRRILDGLPSQSLSVYHTVPRIGGMLQTALEEFLPDLKSETDADPKEPSMAEFDPNPFFFSPAQLAGAFQASTPSEDAMRGALKHLGYNVTRSHCKPGSLKTNAPWSTIIWVMKEWIRQKSPVKKEKIKPNSPAWRLLDLKNDPELMAQNGKSEGEDGEGQKVDEGAAQSQSQAQPQLACTTVRSEEEELRKTLVFNKELEKLGHDHGAKGIVRYQINPRENWGPMTRAKGV